ncbi:hypothetical protein [Bacillus sp. JJ675]|uniref:hypothetical protein n=1 Tax=Bacillus sp. JJ675 TaxID=3122972 RepID=UPI002FFE78D1
MNDIKSIVISKPLYKYLVIKNREGGQQNMKAEVTSFSFNAANGDMGLEIYSDFSAENLQLLWQKGRIAAV